MELRLRDCIDPVAVEQHYHKSCNTNFLLENPGKLKQSHGQPKDTTMLTAFYSLCDWIEMRLMLSFTRLVSIMKNATYTPKCLKQKLLDRYGDHIYLSEVEGKTMYSVFEIWLIF